MPRLSEKKRLENFEKLVFSKPSDSVNPEKEAKIDVALKCVSNDRGNV
jgi:hypothetical protein